MEKIALKNGVRMFLGFSALFLIAHLLNISDNYNLRILNGIIHLTFMYLAIREYRKAFPKTTNNYLSGVAMGMFASIIGVLIFTIAMFLFLFFNPTFFELLQSKAPLPKYFTPFTASLLILTEGIAISLIGSYILVRIIDAQVKPAR